MQLLEVENYLLEVVDLGKSYKNRDVNFVQHVVDWLERFEKVLEQNRMSEAGILAGKKTIIISADRGNVPEYLNIIGRETKAKWRNAAAIHAIQFVTDLVENSISKDKIRRDEALEIVFKITALAQARGLPGFTPEAGVFSDEQLWNIVSNDPEIQGGIVQLQGLVGRNDAIVLLGIGYKR